MISVGLTHCFYMYNLISSECSQIKISAVTYVNCGHLPNCYKVYYYFTHLDTTLIQSLTSFKKMCLCNLNNTFGVFNYN